MSALELPKYLRIQFYKTQAGEWRWRMRAPNGRVVAAASEAYKKRMGAVENATVVTGFEFPKVSRTRLVEFGFTIRKPMWRGRKAT